MTAETWWYLARSSGIVAMILSGLSVLWGLSASGRFLKQRFTKASLVDTHKVLGAAALIFTCGHIASIIMNAHQGFTVADAFIPFRSPFSANAIAWGICAFYLLIAVEVSSLYMKHIPRRLWKGIHLSSYVVFFAGIMHGAGAGTDAGEPAYVAGAVLFTAVISVMTVLRILKSVPSSGVPQSHTNAVRLHAHTQGSPVAATGQHVDVESVFAGNAAFGGEPLFAPPVTPDRP